MSVRRVSLISLMALALGASVAAALHTHLVKAEPAVDATVSEAPKQIRLWFSERPEVALSSAVVLTSDSAPVARIAMSRTDDTLSVAGPLTVTLAPGKYLVVWKTGSPDGHAVRGSYSFDYNAEAGSRP
jgi:copper resistance protein C